MCGIRFGENKSVTSSEEDESEVEDDFAHDFMLLSADNVDPLPAEKDVTNKVSEENESEVK